MKRKIYDLWTMLAILILSTPYGIEKTTSSTQDYAIICVGTLALISTLIYLTKCGRIDKYRYLITHTQCKKAPKLLTCAIAVLITTTGILMILFALSDVISILPYAILMCIVSVRTEEINTTNGAKKEVE